MIGYEVEIKGLEAQLKKIEALPQVAGRELGVAMQQTVAAVASAGKVAAPVGVSGELRAGINGKVTRVAGADVEGKVGSSVGYGWFVEKGTKPHWPPLEPLMLWVRRKLGVQEEQVFQAARSIQRKIAARGTKGQKFLQTGFEKSKDKVDRYFAAALERIAKAMEVR